VCGKEGGREEGREGGRFAPIVDEDGEAVLVVGVTAQRLDVEGVVASTRVSLGGLDWKREGGREGGVGEKEEEEEAGRQEGRERRKEKDESLTEISRLCAMQTDAVFFRGSCLRWQRNSCDESDTRTSPPLFPPSLPPFLSSSLPPYHS